ncbi:MAG TPA: hypothetical protein H9836_02285 [Candidatus Nocardiopsis merdipullorum]|nr:hypothetical protein [Candidatus Nocardiopsis merdipullorum]
MTQRRGNGLLADAYVPLILLAPSHADLMLEALRRSGIAAYAVPLAGDVLEPAGGEADTPPTDHLYVDADERPAAEQVLGTELPEIGLQENEGTEDGEGGADPKDTTENPSRGDLLDGPPNSVDPGGEPVSADDDDEVWKDLVARFYDEREDPTDQRRRVAWPDAENLSASDEREDDSASSRIGDLLAGRARKEKDDADEADDADADEEAEEALRRAEAEIEGHYEPPPPSPLIQGDRVGVAAWFGLLSAPVVLFGSAFLSISLPNWLMLLLVLAFLSSFVVLVLRMTDNRPPGDDGPDDGAVI